MAELKPDFPVLLGRSIHYGRVVLVDDGGREAEEGELYITGLGVAVGYYRNAELTAKCFVQWNGERAYRTGDFGRQTPDGIMFLGRRDSFVKNRGFLINLEGDVEPAMSSFPMVKAAVALQHKGRLYGIVTPQIASEGLRDYLAERYSAFIIPDVVLSRDAFPSTTNGKIDRKALLEIIIAWENQAEVVEAGEILTSEDAVRKVFSETLGVPVLNINLSSSFRNLGGHSLAAIIAVATLRKLSFFITVPEVLQLDTVRAISSVVRTSDQTNSSGATDFDERSRELRDTILSDVLLEVDIEEVAPMTDMQARLVRTSIDLPSQNFVKVAMTFGHKDSQTLDVLRQSWSTVLQRHSIFRTSYLLSVDNGVQLVHRSCNLSWNEITVNEESWESACLEVEKSGPDYLATFDEKSLKSLSTFQIITIPGNRSRLFWTVHHSLIDGWSISHILSEVRAVSDGQVPQDFPPQFSEAALWIELAENKDREAAKAFWSRRLRDVTSNSRNIQVAQPSDRHQLLAQSERSLTVALKMADLNEFARALHVTLASVIYSAWAMLLARYAGADKVVFGAVLAGRNLPIPSVEKLAGPLMNSLPFTVEVDDAKSVKELLHTIFTSLCEIYEYQWSSNSLIQEATGTKGADFYESMLSLQYDFPRPSSDWQVIGSPKEITYSEVTEIPLTVIVDKEGGDLTLRFIYKRSHLGDGQIERLMNHFVNILKKLIQSPGSCLVHEMTTHMMGSSEVASRLNNSDHLELAYTGHRTLKEALESCAEQWKDYVAVRSTARHVTYRELDELANRAANNLILHVASGDVVCIISDGSVEWLLAILAVIKCGAAYCPIDIRLPAERQTLMLEASGCSIALYPTTSSIEESPVFPGVVAMAVDAILNEPLQRCDHLKRDVSPQDMVCLVFTSGSTGTPKGQLYVEAHLQASYSKQEYNYGTMGSYPYSNMNRLGSLQNQVNQMPSFFPLVSAVFRYHVSLFTHCAPFRLRWMR
jgi:non-ribosomal peptide synthetase component F